MINIFTYTDYRKFLRDYYALKKSENRNFSYRFLANRAGFKSKSFLVHVMDGKANLSLESTSSVANALGLSERRCEYFKSLVLYNQTDSAEEKRRLLGVLAEFREAHTARILRDNEFEYLATWYHCTIRELVVLVDFKDDYRLLASLVRPAITARQAKKSVELLLRLGLLRREGRGYVQSEPTLTTGDDVRAMAAAKFHHDNLQLAARSISEVPQNEREIGTVVGSMSPHCQDQVREEIRQFRRKILGLLAQDSGGEKTVFHVNLQLFPTSCRMREDEE